jgi:ubiquinone/menaquinone biosynthesis C-methylase UbiE
MTAERLIETIDQAYSRVAGHYDEHYLDPVSEAENKLVFSFLEQALPHGRVVDLGCGTGLALDRLSISPDEYVGVDISAGMLAIARQKHPRYQFVKADMTRLPFEDASFDSAISLFGPPSYCRSLAAVRQELRRVLRPGGVYFLMLYGLRHKTKGAACVIEESNADGLMRSHYSSEYVRSNFPGALVFGMTTTDDYEAPISAIDDKFITRNLVRGLISPDESYYLLVYGTTDGEKDTSTLKFTCTTWRGDIEPARAGRQGR